MSSVNKVILIGNLGRDPESRTFASGDKVVSFSLATTESWRDKATGERKDKTEWHNVSVFNENIGRVVEQYCRKGSKVYIEGKIETREYEKDGVKRYATEIVIPRYQGEITMLDGKSDGDASESHSGGSGPSPAKSSRPIANHNPLGQHMDDDIPF